MQPELPDGYYIEYASPDMAEDLFRLAKEAMSTTTSAYQHAEVEPMLKAIENKEEKYLNYFKRNADVYCPSDHMIYVVKDGQDKVVAMADLMMNQKDREGWLVNCYKAPSCHEPAVASALVDHMLLIASNRGIDTVKLDSTLNAVQFYQRLGFEIGDEKTLFSNLTLDDESQPFPEVRMIKHIGLFEPKQADKSSCLQV